MKTLYYQYDLNIESTYIIRMANNNISKQLANRCSDSCKKINQSHCFWDAYDGTNPTIQIPEHHNAVMDLIKITNHCLSRTEVATALSHISLWVKCSLQDKPIVILEHDAIMLQPYKKHEIFNSIGYLGSREQYHNGWPVFPTPPHGTDGPNYHFLCRAHAYSIDPAISKNLISHVIKYGINMSLDMLLRADIFPMHQTGIFAYDEPDLANTTITGRNATAIRNDYLKI